MLGLINLHLAYIFNKRNVIIISLISFFYFVLCLVKVNLFENVNNQLLFEEQHKIEYDYITLLIGELTTCLISTYLFSKTQNISYFLLVKTTKFKFYFTKMISNVLIILLFCLSIFFVYIFVGMVFSKWFYLDKQIIIRFVFLFFKSVVLGFISLLLSNVFKSSFGFILVFIFYIVINNVFEKGIYTQIIGIFLPLFCDDFIDLFRLIIQIFFYFLSCFFLFLKNENY